MSEPRPWPMDDAQAKLDDDWVSMDERIGLFRPLRPKIDDDWISMDYVFDDEWIAMDDRLGPPSQIILNAMKT